MMGWFSARVGPGTVTNGSDLYNSQWRYGHYLGRPILKPFREHSPLDPQHQNLKSGHESNQIYDRSPSRDPRGIDFNVPGLGPREKYLFTFALPSGAAAPQTPSYSRGLLPPKPGLPPPRPPRKSIQGGFCRQKQRHSNTDPKLGPGG